MKAGNDAIKMIKFFEGFRSEAYRCSAGKLTIGFGSTLVHGLKVVSGQRCTREEAEQYLLDELTSIEFRLSKLVKSDITQSQFDALADFCYNLGTGNLESSTLLKKLNAGDYDGAASEFIKWNKYTNPVTGKKEPLAGLTARRNAETYLFINGSLPTSVV